MNNAKFMIQSFRGGYDNNFSYLVTCKNTQTQFLVDAAIPIQEIVPYVSKNISFIFITHTHGDHIAYLNDVIDNNDMGTWVLISQAYLSLINGDLKKGMEHINNLEKIGITDSEMKYRLAHFYIMLNDETKALKALEESVDGGFFCYSYIESDPLTNPIHNHPKFKQIVEKAKLRHELYEKRFGDDIRSLLGTAS